jgi:hypothetical protein
MSRPARSAVLSVVAGGITYPVLRRWATGFAVASGEVPVLEGVVDLYSGADHLRQCLITSRELHEGEQIFTVKQASGYDYAAATEGDDVARGEARRRTGTPADTRQKTP